LNKTHQPPLYADDVSLVGGNINTITKNTQSILEASNEVDLKVNAEITKYMLMSRHNPGQNQNIKIIN
jgi:hypothetical protein